MKIIKIIGGLGNQMFQYALAIALQQQYKDEEIRLDLNCFRGYNKHQGYLLDEIFGRRFRAASLQEVARLAWPYPHYQLWRVGSRVLPRRQTMVCEPADGSFSPDVLTLEGNRYYDGYWQDERYFKAYRKEIVEAFKFSPFVGDGNRHVENMLRNERFASLHVRRGDYLNDALYQNTCGIDYYQRAISQMNAMANPSCYFIFSDDIAWCKTHIEPLCEGHRPYYIDWNKGKEAYRDMQLMALCKYHIIANSSFSWWGAWLNDAEDGITIAPQQWYSRGNKPSPASESWIKV